LSIDGYSADFHSFFNGIVLLQRRARLCEMALVLIRFISFDDAIVAHLCEEKKYLNNGLDFFIKLVSVLLSKMARSCLTGRFHSGESSICQSGTLQYETMKNF
jgi:hypothetical protein